MKIYNELESLGFFEWLKEKGFGSGFTAMILDAQAFDSIGRSGYNAIAFRWFRETYDLPSHIATHYQPDWDAYSYRYYFIQDKTEWNGIEHYKTYEEAELECLKKLIEIVKNL